MLASVNESEVGIRIGSFFIGKGFAISVLIALGHPTMTWSYGVHPERSCGTIVKVLPLCSSKVTAA